MGYITVKRAGQAPAEAVAGNPRGFLLPRLQAEANRVVPTADVAVCPPLPLLEGPKDRPKQHTVG
jgi:hypothetical protein